MLAYIPVGLSFERKLGQLSPAFDLDVVFLGSAGWAILMRQVGQGHQQVAQFALDLFKLIVQILDARRETSFMRAISPCT